MSGGRRHHSRDRCPRSRGWVRIAPATMSPMSMSVAAWRRRLMGGCHRRPRRQTPRILRVQVAVLSNWGADPQTQTDASTARTRIDRRACREATRTTLSTGDRHRQRGLNCSERGAKGWVNDVQRLRGTMGGPRDRHRESALEPSPLRMCSTVETV